MLVQLNINEIIRNENKYFFYNNIIANRDQYIMIV